MGSDSDEEEFASRKKKSVARASGNLRTLPAWKQEVIDEEGQRSFHGAYTGGYYNTVGSKEGWAPQSFTSSRKKRAGTRKQSISDFLDEDEKAEFEGRSLSANSQFDTFGFTAVEHSRKQAEKEQHERPSAIPGLVHDELVAPVSESIASLSACQVSDLQEPKKETLLEELEVDVEVERPVDLYKAIFSDDSEDDEEQSMNGKRQEGQEKKNEAAATTLNRLIAGDFLESLGKELGFEVPSDIVTNPEETKPMEEDNNFKGKSDASSEIRLGLKENSEKSPSKWSSRNDRSSSELSSGDERRRKRFKNSDLV